MADRTMTFGKTILASCLGYTLAAFGFTAIGIVVITMMILGSLRETGPGIPSQAVLELKCERGIVEQKGGSIFTATGGIELRRLVDAIRYAGADERIEGIVLRVGQLECGPAQRLEVRDALLSFKRSSKKWVVAVIDEAGTSEWEYLLATAADSILIHPAGELEVNGFTVSTPYFKPAMERIGIKAEVFKSGRYKSAVEPFVLDSGSTESRENSLGIMSDAADQFRSIVAASRRISTSQVNQLLDSGILLRAADAHRAHLVDGVAYSDQVDEMIRKKIGLDSARKVSYIDVDDYARELMEDEDVGGTQQIAIVYAVGAIAGGQSRFDPNPIMGGGAVVGSTTFSEAMREARESDAVKVVVLRIVSPGGLMTASDVMYREVVLTRRRKPVIVSMGDVAASGGYYIAAPADTIVADSVTLTGSIGVFGLLFNMGPLLRETLGINLDVLRTNPHADLMSGDRDLTDRERSLIQSLVDSSYARFLTIVAEGRRLSVDSVHAIAQGRVWTGAQARRIGLVDELGGLDRAIDIARQRVHLQANDVTYRILPRQDTYLQMFLEAMGASVALLGRDHYSAAEIAERNVMLLRQMAGIQYRAPSLAVR